jgi:hypothetical protein
MHQIMIIRAGLISALLLVGSLSAVSAELDLDLQEFIDSESTVTLNGVLANIGPSGVRVPGADSGIVVASPSRANPDCKWIVKRAISPLLIRSGRILTCVTRLVLMDERCRPDVQIPR